MINFEVAGFAHFARIHDPLCVDTLGGQFCATTFIVACLAHALRVVLILDMITVGDFRQTSADSSLLHLNLSHCNSIILKLFDLRDMRLCDGKLSCGQNLRIFFAFQY